MSWKEDLIGSGVLIAGTTLAGLIGYGTYGYFRDKGWSTWKAGATTGLIGGALSAAVLIGGRHTGLLSIGQLPRAYPTPWRLVPKQVVSVAMKGVCGACR